MTELGANSLSDLLSGGIWGLLFILSRIGTAFAYMPGLGDQQVNMQTRLLISVGLSFILMPILWQYLPPVPETVGEMVVLLVHEFLWGLFLGIVPRLMLMALDITGFLVASNAGLAAAISFNPSMSSSGPIVTAFLTMTAILLLFVTNMHHFIIEALVGSYKMFPPGESMPSGDMANMVTTVIGHAFALGVQLAAPFVVLGLVFNVGLGLLARLVPQMQVFLVALPVQIMVGLLILSLVIGTLLQLWLADFQETYLRLFQ